MSALSSGSPVGGAAFPQVAPDQAPESCGSHCGPQCGGQCDPHAIRMGVDSVRFAVLLLALALASSWFTAYGVPFRWAALALWVAGVAVLATSRYRAPRRG